MFAMDNTNEEVAALFAKADENAGEIPILHVSLTNSLTGVEGGRLVADYLDSHPETEELLLHNSPIGDKGMAALASAIARHPGLLKFKAQHTGMSAEGVAAFFKNGGFTPRLLDFGLKEPNYPATDEAIKTHLGGISSKNLLDVDGAVPAEIRALAEDNQGKRDAFIELLLDKDIKELSSHDLREVYERRPSLFYDVDTWGDKYYEQIEGTDLDTPEAEEFVKSRFHFAQEDLKQLLAEMPALPAESLSTPNETGFAALDNPALWENKSIEDFKSIPLSQDLLKAVTPKGGSLLGSAFHSLPAGEVLAHLNEQGIKIRGDSLLQEDKPSPLLEQLIDTGNAPALFTLDNWRGASRSEVLKVYETLPEGQQAKTGIHSLLQQISTSNQTLGR